MPDWRRYVRENLPDLGLSATREADIVEELAQQLEGRYEAARAEGLAEAPARERAMAEVPDWPELAARIREARRPLRGPNVFGDLARDLRVGIRMLAKARGFTAAAAITLALAVGANTAIFTVLQRVVLRPLPFPEPERLVTLWENNLKDGIERDDVSPANFLEWRDRNGVFDEIAASDPYSFDYTGGHDPEKFLGAYLTEGFFRILRARPLHGRLFTREEYGKGYGNALVLTHGLWQRRFGGDPSVVGRVLTVNGAPRTVVGILPPEFELRLHRPEPEIYAPRGVDESWRLQRRATYLKVIARLKTGMAAGQARVEMKKIAGQLASERPADNAGVGVTLVPFEDHLVGGARNVLLILMGAAGVVLLIACANVANLLLARGLEREREFAVRRAMGAGGARLARQLLAESLLLAGIGCGVAVPIAYWALKLIVRSGAAGIPRLEGLGLNAAALGFAAALGTIAVVVFGLAPALAVTRADLHSTLKNSGRGTTGGRRRATARGALAVAEVALTAVLLVSAGLLLRSLDRLLRNSPGIAGRVIVLQQFTWRAYRTPEQRLAYGERVIERLRAVPGVRSAGIVTAFPLLDSSTDTSYPVTVEGEPAPAAGQERTAYQTIASPEYFAAAGLSLLRGRALTAFDDADARQVAVVNETMARRFFPNRDPVGRRIAVHFPRDSRNRGPARGPAMLEVVGVVGDVRHESLADTPRPEFFQPFAQNPSGSIIFVARASDTALPLESELKQAIWEVDRSLPFYRVAAMDTLVGESVAARRFQAALLACFAALALTLAAVGIYGVVSFATAQRTHEIGVRIALGARPGEVIAMVLRSGLRLAAVGAAIGLAGAFVASRALSALLYGISPTDPLTYAAAGIVVIAVTAQACWIPARRATRVDPVQALRS